MIPERIKRFRRTAHGRQRKRDESRAYAARHYGYAPSPREGDCPPRPVDGCCECCSRPTKLFRLDHDHVTGRFRGWVCNPCNLAGDDAERLQKRVAFLVTRARVRVTKSAFLPLLPCSGN